MRQAATEDRNKRTGNQKQRVKQDNVLEGQGGSRKSHQRRSFDPFCERGEGLKNSAGGESDKGTKRGRGSIFNLRGGKGIQIRESVRSLGSSVLPQGEEEETCKVEKWKGANGILREVQTLQGQF